MATSLEKQSTKKYVKYNFSSSALVEPQILADFSKMKMKLFTPTKCSILILEYSLRVVKKSLEDLRCMKKETTRWAKSLKKWRKKESMSSVMEQYIRANGKATLDMVMESNSGQMALGMKASGETTKPTEKELSTMSTGISSKANGKTIKPTDMVYINMLTELAMKATGRMTYKTAMESRLGLMAPNMKATTLKVRNMDKERIPGKTALHMLVTGS